MSEREYSYVYILPTYNGDIKIGKADDVDARINNLKYTFDFSKSKVIKCDFGYSYKFEKLLHNMFLEYSIEKEYSDGYTEFFNICIYDDLLETVEFLMNKNNYIFSLENYIQKKKQKVKKVKKIIDSNKVSLTGLKNIVNSLTNNNGIINITYSDNYYEVDKYIEELAAKKILCNVFEHISDTEITCYLFNFMGDFSEDLKYFLKLVEVNPNNFLLKIEDVNCKFISINEDEDFYFTKKYLKLYIDFNNEIFENRTNYIDKFKKNSVFSHSILECDEKKLVLNLGDSIEYFEAIYPKLFQFASNL